MEKMDAQNMNENSMGEFIGRPYKIMDYDGKKRVGVVAKDFNDLLVHARVKLNLAPDTPIRVALEDDGTEVDDDDYFNTLENHTALIILVEDQHWLPTGKYSRYGYVWDEPDGEERPPPPHLEKLVDQLYSDLTCITLLGGKELELLADMDPSCIAEMFPEHDRPLLDHLKEASVRFLAEKEEAKEAIELLKLYHNRHVAAARNEREQQEQEEEEDSEDEDEE